jgi:Mg2+ and Co2+ transporter CorA
MSVWRRGERPQICDPQAIDEADGILWIDLDCEAAAATEIVKVLSGRCAGLTLEMVEDLLTPDEEPKGRDYTGGEIRLASTFSVVAHRREIKRERGEPRPAGSLTFQPVELLAGNDWLITSWHPPRTVRGIERTDDGPHGDPARIYEEVAQVWAGGKGENAGDLGLLIMHELALTYAPAHRAIYTWLEDWELGFYTEDDRFDRHGLAELWAIRAVLRDWLEPLNRPGLRHDLAKAWLPGATHQLVVDVDDRIDKALSNLARLGEALRASFSLLHVQQSEQARQRTEEMQHRIEIIGFPFLIATLIVGLYGANTWVPGQQKHWGFWVMVGALLLFTLGAVSLVRQWRRAQQAEANARAEEQKRLRTEVLRVG